MVNPIDRRTAAHGTALVHYPAGGLHSQRRGACLMAEVPKPAENPFVQYHVVKSGDTLSKIAGQYYGDESLYPKIFEANRQLIKNPDLIQVGWKLRIP